MGGEWRATIDIGHRVAMTVVGVVEGILARRDENKEGAPTLLSRLFKEANVTLYEFPQNCCFWRRLRYLSWNYRESFLKISQTAGFSNMQPLSK